MKEVFDKIADAFCVLWMVGIIGLFIFIIVKFAIVSFTWGGTKALLAFFGILAFIIISALCQSRIERWGEDTNE